MCGIAGIWHLDGTAMTHAKLRRFTDSLTHRGPDGAGYELYFDERLGLGHRRLSVLDLSDCGKQPMEFGEARYSITFNGEVYNFLELRQELSQLGYQFRTESDTEVILAAYDRWGIDCMSRFNGMWALAVLDKKERTLVLSRDRFGVKPLHYLHVPGKLFAFASETVAFRELDGFERRLDDEAFARSMADFSCLEAYGYTIYQGIHQLLPGHFMVVTAAGPGPQTRWWDTLAACPLNRSEYSAQVEEFSELFRSACKLRLRSDVPVASALSGGLDSSAVYCMVHRLNRESPEQLERLPANWQTAFVATFPGTTVDERAYAEQVVEWVQGRARYLTPDYGNLVRDLENTTLLFDGISGTPLICLTDVYKAMRSDGVVVSLDGHGVDELMFGYRSSVYRALVGAVQAGDAAAVAAYKEIYLGMLFEHEKAAKTAQVEQLMAGRRTSAWRGLLAKFKKSLRPNVCSGVPAPTPASWQRQRAARHLPFLTPDFERLQQRPVDDPVNYSNFHYLELPYNLRDFDRGSMQHGIEIRMPFMDYRLVSFLFGLQPTSKLGDGYTKRILRDALKGVLPEPIRTRKLKIGLGSPLVEWFNGALNTYLQDTVASKAFSDNPYINVPEVRSFVLTRCADKSWTDAECSQFWPILNAHLLLSGQTERSTFQPVPVVQ